MEGAGMQLSRLSRSRPIRFRHQDRWSVEVWLEQGRVLLRMGWFQFQHSRRVELLQVGLPWLVSIHRRVGV